MGRWELAHEASALAGLAVCSQEQPWGAATFSWDSSRVPESSSRAELLLGTEQGAGSCRESWEYWEERAAVS